MRRMIAGLVVAISAVSAGWAFAQSKSHTPQNGQQGSSYATLKDRPIKALSETQIADLRAGRGMGLALAAELNGFPGPLHVLQLADPLALTPGQRDQIEAQIERMKGEASAIGEDVIALETELDGLFASRAVTPASLDAVTSRLGQRQAALRAVHLKYHLSTVAALTPDQVHRYNVLRGYAIDHAGHGVKP